MEDVFEYINQLIAENGLEVTFGDLPEEQQKVLTNLIMHEDDDHEWMSSQFSEEEIERYDLIVLDIDQLPALFDGVRDYYYDKAEQLYDDALYSCQVHYGDNDYGDE